MHPTPAPWETRLHRTVVAGQWVALTVGIVSSLIIADASGQSLAAMAIASLYVIGTTLMPEHRFRVRFGSEAFSLGGAIVILVALTLTGGASSPYLLLSMGPPIFATIYGGFRSGLTTGFLSGALLVLITIARDLPIVDAAPAMALYLIFVLLVGVIRRLLDDIHTQARTLLDEKESATVQLVRLEETHNALLKLAEDVSTGRLNATEVGADTLDTILERFPGSSGKLSIDGESGPVVLAARGIPEEEAHTYMFPLSSSDDEVGHLELTSRVELDDGDRSTVESIIRPVGVAFANLRLLNDIVGSAVSEERTRLAREMHDEVGPALASLGLALDMTAMQQAHHPELAADIQVLRSNVTKLVEDVRASVADLRNEPGPTLTARIHQSIAGMDGEPPLVVDLEERRPPRPAQIGDLTSIVTEAARNAYNHSKASKVVISGHVDRTFGTVSVVDDGVGFDPSYEPEGHFGLTGMKERASKIGAGIKFDSKPGVGTAVTVEWGTK